MDSIDFLFKIPQAALPSGQSIRMVVEGIEVLLIHTSEGIRVYQGVCPHLGGPLLEGVLKGRWLRCPWHHYQFDVITGDCVTHPGKSWESVGRRCAEKVRCR